MVMVEFIYAKSPHLSCAPVYKRPIVVDKIV